MWDGVFDEVRPGLLSEPDDLARAEAELRFALPPSFKEFARTFGAGRIGGSVRIYTPVPIPAADLVTRAHLIAHAVATAIDALAANPLTRDEPHRFTVEGDADAAMMERAFFFGEAEGGAFLFFDVVPDAEEYEVWVLAPDLETIHHGGPDFATFVRDLQSGEVAHILGPEVAPLAPDFEGDDAAALAALGGAEPA